MLTNLTVWNFALLEHVEVEFGPGLNILTGETGAGKSILIDAVGAALGQRLSADSIRTGADSLRVEAVFDLSTDSQNKLPAILEDQAIDLSDNILIVTRQVNRNGRSAILLNGRHVTLSFLKKIGPLLMDIHGQHENLAILREEQQLALLDNYHRDGMALRQNYRQQFSQWCQAVEALEQRRESARDSAQRLDMLQWQQKEITDAQLRDGEEEQLEQEIKKLSHAEKITDSIQEAYAMMDGSGRNMPGVLAQLSTIKKNLQDISQYDNSLDNARKIVEEAEISLQEAAYDIRDYAEDMEFDPQRLDKLQHRMDVIYKLEKKYGSTIPEVLQHLQQVQQELAGIENYDEDISQLEKKVAEANKQVLKAASELTALRKKAAAELSHSICQQLTLLGMPKAAFRIAVTPLEKLSANGADSITLWFSANPGETEKPLQRVASGGELSRIALAIKSITAASDDAPFSMIFDEIDTGIGGRTAQMVAERIAVVAAFRQVLCITHLPQIACMADQHIYIAKKVTADSSHTVVQLLNEAEQVSEIARMASGDDVTATALDNAREMLMKAAVKKSSIDKAVR